MVQVIQRWSSGAVEQTRIRYFVSPQGRTSQQSQHHTESLGLPASESLVEKTLRRRDLQQGLQSVTDPGKGD